MTSVFKLLNKSIQEFLYQNNINTPTEPQQIAIPPILKGKNILLIAPTGLGKTEAALLPIFHNFLIQQNEPTTKKNIGISILYITPLRALNRDMLRRTIEWGHKLGITVAVRHGDTSQSERAKQTRKPPDMLITTPETLQILFTGKKLRTYLRTVHCVVIDEIHELVSDERGAQLAVALERLHEITSEAGHSFQRIGLSATVGHATEVARFLGGLEHTTPRPVSIFEVDVTKHLNISVELPTTHPSDVTTADALSIDPYAFSLLRRCKELIEAHTSTLLFINTRDGAEILASRFHLWQKDMKISVHHGSLSKTARIEAENDFKNGILQSLICTSSLELGIDVGNTDYVIQYNSPREVTRIVQRIGRSGHKVGRTSEGVILATNPEDFAESIVIARKALAGEVEETLVRKNPLTVLSNQIVLMVLEYGKVDSKKLYNILTRAYIFQTLSLDVFKKTLQQLKDQRILWIQHEEGTQYLIKKISSREYFLDNISMIPDEKTYPVIDATTRKIIGTLDESFVLSSVYEGEKFILRGRPWIIAKRDEESVLVSPAKEIGTVPSWIGEDIPVPYSVAREVGELRSKIANNQTPSDYPCNKQSLSTFIDAIQQQKNKGFKVPDHQTITIETDNRVIIINACFGTKVNETIGRLISAVLAQSFGESIGINSDAYRIQLELPGNIPYEGIRNIFFTTPPENLEYLMRTIIKNSTFMRWQLVHVARKFGALRKDFDYKNIGLKKLFDIFESSMVFDEAIDKILWERMDIAHTCTVLQEIQNGTITIHHQGLSPIALSGFETIRGLMVPARADRAILMALKKRLEDVDILLVCTNCHHTWNTTVGRAGKQPKCSRCDAIKIAVLRRYNKDLVNLLSKRNRTQEENREVQRIHKNASLVLTYGTTAIQTLVGRGIGPDTAARILRRYTPHELHTSEEAQINFLRDILKAELHYAKTRGFWDI